MPRLPRKVARHNGGRSIATRASPVPQVARLPRKTTVDVTKCHACHVKRRRMSPSATPATQSGAVSTGTPKPAQSRKYLPRKRKLDVTKRHACHVKRRRRSPMGDQARHEPAGARCHQVPRLPRETTADVTKCRACHATWRGLTGDQARHQSQPSPISSAPATQNEARCHQVPRLPRKTKVDVTKCHACHLKRRRMSPSAKPATRDGGPSAHQSQPSPISSTPAMQKRS